MAERKRFFWQTKAELARRGEDHILPKYGNKLRTHTKAHNAAQLREISISLFGADFLSFFFLLVVGGGGTI